MGNNVNYDRARPVLVLSLVGVVHSCTYGIRKIVYLDGVPWKCVERMHGSTHLYLACTHAVGKSCSVSSSNVPGS